MTTKLTAQALVWRDEEGQMIGFLVGDTQSGTQVTAEATLDLSMARWETVTIEIPRSGKWTPVNGIPLIHIPVIMKEQN